MKKYISQRLRTLRNEAKMSQEQLAHKLGVTTQAVSKWECDLAYPDIELLMQIADIYGVTIDSLLREQVEGDSKITEPSEKDIAAWEAAQPADEKIVDWEAKEPGNDIISNLNLPDDDVIRVIQFKGRRLITRDMLDDEVVIPIHIIDERGFSLCKSEINIEIWGNVSVDGDLVGNVKNGGVVECGDIVGNVKANGCVTCADITGNLEANGSVECSDVEGNVHAGGYVCCGDVEGSVNCGGYLECGDIEGDVQSCAGGISCGDIEGSIRSCIGDIHCGDIEGNVYCEGNIHH